MKIVFATDFHISSASPSSRVDDYAKAILTKFGRVLELCEKLGGILVLGGDLFDKPAQPDYIKNQISDLIKRYEVKVYSIVGNHDILYYNVDSLVKTSLQVVFNNDIQYLEVPEVLPDGTRLVPHTFLGEFPKDLTSKDIVISHTLLETQPRDKLTLSPQTIEESGAGFVCMGHDHDQYPIRKCGSSLVVRPGALSRGSATDECKTREVSVAVLDTVTATCDYYPIPCQHADYIFKTKVKADKKAIPTFDQIKEFMTRFKTTTSNVNAFDILYNFNLSDDVHQKTEGYLISCGVNQKQ